MKKKAPYILKEAEIASLLAALDAHGLKQTYEQMKVRATIAMEKDGNVDEMFLDMYDTMITKARALNMEDETEKQLQPGYYTIASMLRRIAHEVHAVYLKTNKDKDSQRFLHLAVNNPEAPTPSW